MIQRIVLLIFVLFIISCEKDEPKDLLTDGTWVLVNQTLSPIETIKFNSDGTYVMEVTLENYYLPTSGTPAFSTLLTIGKLAGDWSLKDKDIEFTNPIVSISENDSLIGTTPILENGHYVIDIQPGETIGSFFGYRYLDIYQNDSTALNGPLTSTNYLSRWRANLNDISYNFYHESTGAPQSLNTWTWTIVKLTERSLEINSYGSIKRYTKK